MTEKRRKADSPFYKFFPSILTIIIMGSGFYATFKVVEYRVQQLEKPGQVKSKSHFNGVYASEIENFRWKNQERINAEIKETIKDLQKEVKQIQIILGKNGYAKLKHKENH